MTRAVRDSDKATMDAAELKARLGISQEAVDILSESELIDLHLDTLVPWRVYGYDPLKRHRRGPFGRHFFGHSDLPRLLEGGVSGGMWSITTNPFRSAASRWRIFQKNLGRFRKIVDRADGAMRFARTPQEYREVRAQGAHAVLLSIQGGNALEAAPEGPASVPDRLLTRVTVVHLTSSVFGVTSTPQSSLRRKHGLTERGREFVRQLDAERVFVDLAHIHPQSFWDAVEVHDKSLPLIATHTGVKGVRPHWRNLDDDQIKAIADSGGVVGIIFQPGFLSRRGGPKDGRMIVEHIKHVVDLVGADHTGVGSDYDGAISPPTDLAGGDMYPRLVQYLLEAGLDGEAIRKILGGAFLASWERLRA